MIEGVEVRGNLITPIEAAKALRISRAQVYRLLKSGDLKSIKIGRRRLLVATALVDFINQKVRESAG